MVFPIIETERLLLRQITNDDVDILFKYWSDNEVTKFMNLSPFKSITQVLEMLRLLNDLFEQQQALRWGITTKFDGQIIGTCGYNTGLNKDSFIGEIGYELGKEYWGFGYMQETLQALIEYGFQCMNLNRIEAYVMVENTVSLNLLNKLGFKREGILREHGYYKDSFWDEVICSLLKKEWESSTAQT